MAPRARARAGTGLAGRVRGDLDRMNGSAHQIPECLVHQPMARNLRQAGELCRDNDQAPMGRAAFAPASVSPMSRAIVHQIDPPRVERTEAAPNFLVDAHGLPPLSWMWRERYSA